MGAAGRFGWRLVAGCVVAAALAGCASVEAGTGRPAEGMATATDAAEPSGDGGSSPSTSSSPSETTATATATDPSDTGGAPTGSEDPAFAFAVGFEFAAHVNTDNLDLAYALLCADVRAEVTLEDFSDGAPEPGTLRFDPGEQVGPGVFSGTLVYGEETDEILLRADGSDDYCVASE